MDKMLRCLVWFLLILVMLCAGCEQNKSPLKIGFAGGLTGRHSDLATASRNGVILAVEEVNSRGGVQGRRVELIVKDNEQNAVVARKVHQELIDQGVVAIVGHMTSAMSSAALPVSNQNKVLMISPTTATNSLTGIDDYFFRVMSPSRKAIRYFAEYLYQDRGLRRVAVVYDESNAAFSAEWLNFITAYYVTAGEGEVVPVPFTSSKDLRFSELAKETLGYKPDGVVLVAASNDAARICQQLQKQDATIPLFATMWSMTEDFLRNGGLAVEGVVFCHWFTEDFPSPRSETFRRHFEQRFGHPPNFASNFAYEATYVLLTALKKNPDPKVLRQTILETQPFHGTQGEIVFDAFGDPKRKIFMLTVENGRFRSLE
jgi:branched-chain amino acid transport system substrate-binding protein